MKPTRRRILELALATHAAAIAEAQQHAHKAMKSGNSGSRKLESFSAEETAEVEALASLIIPSGATAGARETGAVYFIDKSLATFESDKREAYRKGLVMVQGRRRELFPGSTSIASLKPDEQLQVAKAIEKTDFFETLRVHTIMGFLAPPQYGGNHDEAGWKLIGFQG
jgi:gluconate 2-dehydrogenase gamma chain